MSDRLAGLIQTSPRPLVIMSWGRPSMAQVRDNSAVAYDGNGPRLWLRSSHPSPLGARRPCGDAPPFMGCGHFQACDRFLHLHGEGPIQWFPLALS